MEDCLRSGVKWGFFMSWSDLVFSQNSVDHMKAIYSNPVVKTLTHMNIPVNNLYTEASSQHVPHRPNEQ